MKEFLLDGMSVRSHILALSSCGNKEFAQSLNPGVENVLGIRVPHLRALARRIARADWELYLSSASVYYMEERMLQGMVLGCIKPDDDIEMYLARVSHFVGIINSWSVCDTFKFAGGTKYVQKHSARIWAYLKLCMAAGEEYTVRFGVVMAISYFIDEAHINELLLLLGGICHDGYYVKMAVAWAVSICFVKYPDKTMDFLTDCPLDDFTYNKSLQKITESYRVDKETKATIRSMKRK